MLSFSESIVTATILKGQPFNVINYFSVYNAIDINNQKFFSEHLVSNNVAIKCLNFLPQF